MAIFPTTWQLLMPNWNITTAIGTIMVIIALVGLFFSLNVMRKTKGVTMFFETANSARRFFVMMLLIGIALIWGVSIVQDFITSTGGALIFWLSVFTAMIGIFLFYDPKGRRWEDGQDNQKEDGWQQLHDTDS